MNPRPWLLFALVAGLTTVACPPPTAKITTKKYKEIKRGMPYDQVVKLIDMKGKKMHSDTLGEIRVETFLWKEKVPPYLVVTFVDRIVSSKHIEYKKWSYVKNRAKYLHSRAKSSAQRDAHRMKMERRKEALRKAAEDRKRKLELQRKKLKDQLDKIKQTE